MRLPGPSAGLHARVRVPASKSLTNRALVGCAVADGGVIDGPLDCADTRVLAAALSDAGWGVEWGTSLRIEPRATVAGTVRVWLGDSGTGARLALALLAATPGRFVVDGGARLRERPIGPLLEALSSLGARLESSDGRLPVTVAGAPLDGGRVTVRPEVSSQFVSALLLAAPLMRDGLDLAVDGPLPSRPYVGLTLDTLRQLGVAVAGDSAAGRWQVAGGRPRPARFAIEGDWSAAAVFVAAAAVAGGRVEIDGVSCGSGQGDRAVIEIVERAGVGVTGRDQGVVVEGPATRPISAGLSDAPDLFPALAAVAASIPSSTITGVEHLRHKESDRLAAMDGNLRGLGAELVLDGPSVRVTRAMARRAGVVRRVTAAGDHRIAMAMAVAALYAGPLEIDDPGCVNKSFPSFWEVWRTLTSPAG